MTPNSPTVAELAILRVLWRQGPSTVRDVHRSVYSETQIGYTSALKLMQNMLGKGLLTRSEESRQHVYDAAVAERPTINGFVRRWIDAAFDGSSGELAMQALDARPVAPEELARLKALIAQIEAARESGR